jgi:hypothetical protein
MMRTISARTLLVIGVVACARSPRAVPRAEPPAPAPQAAAAPAITSAEQLIGAMRERYAGKWYRAVTFVQRNTLTRRDGTTQPSTWLEAMQLPGKLRIDFEPREQGSGMLFVRDTQYVFTNGRLHSSARLPHPLLLLGFDVYELPASETIAKLREIGFDLSVMHEDTWQGRPAYAVGAAAGDLRRRQFWIDREHLYFVRMLEPAGRDSSSVRETRFNKYQRLGGGWIAPEVEILTDGKRAFLEQYEEITVDPPLDPSLFDPAQFRTAKHWRAR